MRTWASSRVSERSRLRHASRSVPLKDSPEPFSQGLPGSIKSVVTPTRVSQSRTAVAMHAGPLSERREVGGPRSTKSWARRASPVVAAPPPGDVAAEALPRVRVHDGQQPEGPPVCGPVADEVVGPDIVGALRPSPHQRAVRQPETAPLGLFRRHPEPLVAPESFHPRVIDAPACLAQSDGDAAGAGAPEARGEGDDARDQRRLIRRRLAHGALRCPHLAGDLAGPSLRHRVRVGEGGRRPAPLGRAQKWLRQI